MNEIVRLSSSDNQWILDDVFYSLGRSRTADLKINRSSASRIHIFLFHDPQRGFLVCDAGSRNGAYLNGRLILKPEVLVNSDVIDVAGESLHVSFDGGGKVEVDAKPAVESGILLAALFNDHGTKWGSDSKLQSRSTGEWFYRIIKLIRSHGGSVIQVSDKGVTGVWDDVEQNDKEAFQGALECARQINHFTLSLDASLRKEWGMIETLPLFVAHAALHFTTFKRRETDRGQIRVDNEDLQFMADLSIKAKETQCSLISTERFPSRPDDRSVSVPMLMAEIGVRRQAMVLFPLRED